MHAEWSLAAAELDLSAVRASLIAGSAPQEVFGALEPQTRSYAMLVAALAEVRRQETDTSEHLPTAPARPLSVGSRYADAPALARVLMRLGELPRSFNVAAIHTTYTKPLSDAITRWQNRKLKKGSVKGQLSASVLEKLLAEWTGASHNGPLREYCMVVVYWLKKRLART